MAEWSGNRPNLVRVQGLGRTRMGGWHVEVSSGWKKHTATLCGLQLPNEYLERKAQWSEVGCEQCQVELARSAAAAEAEAAAYAANKKRGVQQASGSKAAPKTEEDKEQGSLF